MKKIGSWWLEGIFQTDWKIAWVRDIDFWSNQGFKSKPKPWHSLIHRRYGVLALGPLRVVVWQ